MPFAYIHLLEGGPVDPGYGRPGGLPGYPAHPLPQPPAGIWPPPSLDHPVLPLPPDKPPLPPGAVWPPITDPNAPTHALLLGWVPGYGYRYVVVDLSLSVGHPLPTPPEAQPKR